VRQWLNARTAERRHAHLPTLELHHDLICRVSVRCNDARKVEGGKRRGQRAERRSVSVMIHPRRPSFPDGTIPRTSRLPS
jgi:hypothetical protein